MISKGPSAFNSLTYGLNDNDVNMLIGMADEDENELIDWRNFLVIGISNKNPNKSVINPGIIRSRAAIAIDAPDMIS